MRLQAWSVVHSFTTYITTLLLFMTLVCLLLLIPFLVSIAENQCLITSKYVIFFSPKWRDCPTLTCLHKKISSPIWRNLAWLKNSKISAGRVGLLLCKRKLTLQGILTERKIVLGRASLLRRADVYSRIYKPLNTQSQISNNI